MADGVSYGILRQIPLTAQANPGVLIADPITDRLAKALMKRGYTVQQFGYGTPAVNLLLDQAKATAELSK